MGACGKELRADGLGGFGRLQCGRRRARSERPTCVAGYAMRLGLAGTIQLEIRNSAATAHNEGRSAAFKPLQRTNQTVHPHRQRAPRFSWLPKRGRSPSAAPR